MTESLASLIEARHFNFRCMAMSVLIAWAVLNVVIGGIAILRGRSKPSPTTLFWGANAAWNVVNLAIGVFGLADSLNHRSGTLLGWDLTQEILFFQKILLVNVGLDIGYVAVGMVLILWGRQGQPGLRDSRRRSRRIDREPMLGSNPEPRRRRSAWTELHSRAAQPIGWALVIQGGFLFAFDVALTALVQGQLTEVWSSL